QEYSLAEAFYESPFYWMMDDVEYMETAKKHRGRFTESFSATRLKCVLGEERVYENVLIIDEQGNRSGEIDVLAVYADRAIILQAKSKKLTITARTGDTKAIQQDFKKAIQDAYDQAFSCGNLLLKPNY